MTFVGILYIWLVPHTIAFLSSDSAEDVVIIIDHISIPWNRIFHILDLFLLLDISLKFVTAYLNKRSVYVFKRSKIAKHYLKNEFIYDLIAAAPFGILLEATGASKSSVAWVKVLRLLRIRDIWRVIKNNAKTKQDALSDFVSQFFSLLVVLHLLACIWYYVSIASVSEGGSNYLNNKLMDPAYDGYGSMYKPNRTDFNKTYKFDEWALSTYWCFATLSAMGHTAPCPRVCTVAPDRAHLP